MGLTFNGKKPNPYDKHLSGKSEVVSKQAKGHMSVKKTKTVGDEHGNQTEQVTPLYDEEELLHKGVLMPKNDACEVTVMGGATLNLGDMEFAKINVSVMVPCPKAELDDTYDFATDWVSNKLNVAIAKIKGS